MASKRIDILYQSVGHVSVYFMQKPTKQWHGVWQRRIITNKKILTDQKKTVKRNSRHSQIHRLLTPVAVHADLVDDVIITWSNMAADMIVVVCWNVHVVAVVVVADVVDCHPEKSGYRRADVRTQEIRLFQHQYKHSFQFKFLSGVLRYRCIFCF